MLVHSPRRPPRCADSAAGFSLLEIVIAMLLLALMTIGMLPLFLSAARTSTSNRSLVAATTFANTQIAALRAQFGNDRTDATCSELEERVNEINTSGLADDPSDSGLTSELGGPREDGKTALPPLNCAAGDAGPIAVVVTVEVFPRGDRQHVLTSLSTEVLVGTP